MRNTKMTEPIKRTPTNPTGKNQYTKLREARERGDIDSATEQDITGTWRDRYKADSLIQILAEHAKGRATMKPTQIKAAEIILDRLEPRLSAVEQTQVGPDEKKTPNQLLAELKPLLLAHPEYLRELGFAPIAPVRAAEATQSGSEATQAGHEAPQQQVIVSTKVASSS